MIKVFKIFLILIVFTNMQASNAKELTESSVKEFVAIFDNAVNEKDVVKIADLISDDVNIIIKVTFLGKTEVINSTKAEYINLLEESWKLTTDYKFTRKKIDIVFEKDVATISSIETESMFVLGEPISVESEGHGKIKVINGNLKFVEMLSQSSM